MFMHNRVEIRQCCLLLVFLAVASFISSCGKDAKDTERETECWKQRPVSMPDAYPKKGGVPLKVWFFDGGSYSPNGEIVKWEWKFVGRGSGGGGWQDYTETEGEAWYTFDKPGFKLGLLRVTDEDGKKSVGAVMIRMRSWFNADPVAVANADPAEGYAPLSVSFTANGSYDPDGEITVWEWDFGEGAGLEDYTATDGEAEHIYTTEGTFTATLRVTDDDGSTREDTINIQVEDCGMPSFNIAVLPTTSDAYLFSDVVFDSLDNPSVCYTAFENDLRIVHHDGSGWTDELVDSAGTAGQNNTMAIAANDDIGIAYADVNAWDLKFAMNTGSSWSVETVDAGTVAKGLPCIAFDSLNLPAISYYDFVSKDLLLAWNDGTSWSISTVFDVGPVGEYSSIRFDSSDNPVIAFWDNNVLTIKLAWFNGASWDIEDVNDSTNHNAHPSLVLDNDLPMISYLENITNDGDLVFAGYDGAAWQLETIDSSGNTGWFTSMELDGDGRQIITYMHRTNADLVLAWKLCGTWQVETLDSAGDLGYYPRIAVDSQGNPLISYYEITQYGPPHKGRIKIASTRVF